MSLNSGTKLGPYEILAAIGAGGMGEVYKARDTRLDRTVAIKVLPEHLASNAELRQRFEREARSISSLNHANICVLHDVGEQSGVHFLVMEYIEGESLSQRLARGPVPTPELIRIGTQVADALEKAHRQGLVHRDLKPGNIMLTKSGAKLLDFGLAKARGALATGASGHDTALTQTKAASGPITEQGRVVGTFQYMSPEQVEGREADARSDIFAFGAVLYEMATGKRAFEGKSSISIASAILEKEPEPISSVQPMTPPALEQVVRTCLAKDPEERWQSAADIGRQLRWISEAGSQAAVTMLPAKVRRRRLERVAWASGVVALLAVAGVLVWMARQPGAPLHAEFAATNGLTFDFMGDVAAPPALSPDGTMVVFGAHTEKEPQALYVRSLRSGAVQRLAGTESAIFPFWSPDSKFIGFFADGKIEKTAAAGGPISIIAATDTAPRGGCWTQDNEILFTPDYARPLFRVSAAGGTAAELTKLGPNHTTHRWPVCLPDGKHFLYYATNHSSPAGDQNGIYLGSIGGKEDKFVVASDAAALYANGYLLYHQQNELVAQKFNATTGTLSGDPHPLTDLVTYDPGTWHLLMTVSANGELLFQRGVATAGGTQFEWADRSGKPLQQLGTPAGHNGFSISPDGKRVVTSIVGRLSDIYILDAQSGMATRLTFDPTNHVYPSWSPDGKKIVYADDQNLGSGPLAAAVHVKAANGTGADEEVYRPPTGAAVWPQYTLDGQNIVFLYANGPTGWEVEAIPASGGKPAVVVKPQTAQANVSQFDVSPDGKWIAYSSNDTGTAQVYVSSFPSGSGRWQVSTNGGLETMWSRNSKDLFFLGTDFNLYSAHYNDDGGQFAITAIQQVMAFHNVPPSGKSFEISPDGSKFLLDIASQQSSAPLTLVVNWPAELKN